MSHPRPSPIVVSSRFNGPPGSGNGGYVAGLVAAHLPGQPVRVTLREPPPLEATLDVHAEVGQVVASFGGAVIVAGEQVASADFAAEPVPPVSFAAAAEAEHRYAGLAAHPFPGCFVCGTDRPAGDGMNLRPGPVSAGPGDVVATTWVPDASLAAEDGLVSEPFVWAALDCPSGWTSDLVARPMVLGRMTASVCARPDVGDPCVVVGRLLGTEGRKTFTASTAYDGDGRALGRAEATWITPRPV